MDIARDKATLYVFYGVACAGKSTTAIRFAYEHSIRTIISTDYVREVQRACTQQTDGPLMKVTHNAWELFGTLSPENIVQGFINHVDAVTPALLAIVHKLSRDGFDAIVEGVHCYSGIVNQFREINGLTVLPRLIIVTSESRLQKHIQRKEEARSQASELKTWKDHTSTLMKIQDFLIQDATQRNIQIIYAD